MPSVPPPEIITSAATLLQNYKVLFCDVWGVVHNGANPYRSACDALAKYRDQHGIVILVSNAPVPKSRVQAMLDRVDVPPGITDDIVSSGDIALAHIRDRKYRKAFYIGPQDRDAAFFRKSTAESVPLDHAEVVVCTGLNDDRSEDANDYLEVLNRALAHKLPFVCANPDLVVDVGGHHFVCAGAIGDLYEHLGGRVFWAGKPHASAYDAAFAAARKLGNEELKKHDALVIGDALRTDIEGARRYGIDALFIAGGIHREDVMVNGAIEKRKLRELFAGKAPHAVAAMHMLDW